MSDYSVVKILDRWRGLIKKNSINPTNFDLNTQTVDQLRMVGFENIEVDNNKINASFRGWRFFNIKVNTTSKVEKFHYEGQIDLDIIYDKKEEELTPLFKN